MFASKRMRIVSFCIVLCAAWSLSIPALAQPLRGSKEFRTLNTDIYEVSVQKNGRTDLKFISGEPIFDNICPAIVLEDEKTSRPLAVDGRYTARIEVNDRLGQGNGFAFGKKNCEWYIRTYPTKPFLTVQVIFVNDSKKPVRVSKLIPWSVGSVKPGAAVIGPGAAQAPILENGRLFYNFSDYAEMVRGHATSQTSLAVFNPVSGRSFIAGFLTSERAYTQVVIERREGAPENAFDLLSAECVYDPPVEVPHQGRLESEIFYVSIAETNPLVGLDRFGKALAVWNLVRDERPFMPHGWDSRSSSLSRDINETVLLANLDIIDKHLKRYGWSHFAIGAGWERASGDWEPNPERFPHGLKPLADEIHRRGMTAGLWIAPFLVAREAPIAREHPEWMAAPNDAGRMLIGTDHSILDVTAPGAYEYVRDLCRKIGGDWGFDALMETDSVYPLMLAEKYHNPGLTRIEALRLGMKALREGLGDQGFIMSATPQPVTGVAADGIRAGRHTAPVWRADNLAGNWGCVETLTNTIRRFHFSPHLYVPDPDCAFFGHEDTRQRWEVQSQPKLTPDQSLAWLTGAALTGGAVKIGDAFTSLTPQEIEILRKLLPSVERPAKPIDLFQEASPAIWSLPMKGEAGEWHILGLFNWDESQAKTISVLFETLGLDPGRYYTVYDFWQEQYHGTAQGRLDMAIPPGAVRLLGLRRFEDRPMFLATDRHFTQGALDHKSIEWNQPTRQLRGIFEAVENTPYNLRILVPEPYNVVQSSVSTGSAQAVLNNRVLTISFDRQNSGPVEWQVQF